MASITQFSAKLTKFIALVALTIGLCAPSQAFAASIVLSNASGRFVDGHIEISSRYRIMLSPAIAQALHNGQELPFTYEFQLTRPRVRAWSRRLSGWFSNSDTLNFQLSFHPLIREYRLIHNGNLRSFHSLHEALSALGTLKHWATAYDPGLAGSTGVFAGRLRLKLDVSQLPKPYQMVTIGHPEWSLDSHWNDVAITKTLGGLLP